MFYTYVLQSEKTRRHYIGSCGDLDRRFAQHQRGEVRSTRGMLPVRVVYLECFETRSEAMKRERLIKSYKGGEGFKKLFQ